MAKRYGRTKRVYSTAQINRINRKYSKGPQGGGGSGGSVMKAELAALEAGGGGGGLAGSYDTDTEFGTLVGKFAIDDLFYLKTRDQGDVTTGSDISTTNKIMTDADFTTVMSDATHITFCFESAVTVATLPSAQANNRAIVYTKDQIVTDPNVVTFPTTSLATIGTTVTVSTYSMLWHFEDVGTNLSGDDYSGLGINLLSKLVRQFGRSSIGFNETAQIGETVNQSVERDYDQDILTIWVTNSGVAPVLS